MRTGLWMTENTWQITFSFHLRLKVIIPQFLVLILTASTSSKWEQNQSLSVTAATSIVTGVKRRALVRAVPAICCTLFFVCNDSTVSAKEMGVKDHLPMDLFNFRWKEGKRVLVFQQCHQLLPVLLCMSMGFHQCSDPFHCCHSFSPESCWFAFSCLMYLH